VFLAALLALGGCAVPQRDAARSRDSSHGSPPAELSQNHLEAESKELKLAIQENPLDGSSHYRLASLLAYQGLDDQAIIGYQRALTIDPTRIAAYHNMGTLMLKRGDVVPAAELFEAAITNNPDYLPAYNNLGKAYYLAGLPELAAASYEEVLRRDPTNTIARHNRDLIITAAAPPPATQRKVYEIPNDVKVSFEGEEELTPPEEELPPKDKPVPKKAAAAEPPTPSAAMLAKMLHNLPYITVEDHAGTVTLNGWTQDERERKMIDRVLARWPKILDLSGTDSGDPQRMIEVDAVLFVVTGTETQSVGFNFLRLINFSYNVFATNNSSRGEPGWKGLPVPEVPNALFQLPSWGSLLTAAVDYDVNIANAIDDQVAVLARPHLTTLNGTPAYFLAGGEFVFRVSGIETGDIKPYPFGTSLSVTPTLLRTPGENGAPRIHIKVEAQRTSVLEFLTAVTDDDSIIFDKLTVISQAVLDRGQTLILSGLNQRESRNTDSGVPILKEIPLVNLVFSEKNTVDENTAIIILLTPRDPAFNDQRNRKNLAFFVKKRRQFVKAKQGTKEDMKKFKQKFPNWQQLAPNRFASHFFLLEKSDLYRRVSGDDLVEEDLDLHLLEDYDYKKNGEGV
jgi:tetratricopeptide (TPR) repeat protein